MLIFGHGIVGRADLPIPAELFGAAAALVLVVSFVTLAAGWRSARLEAPSERAWLPLPRAVDAVLGLLGVALFAVGVYAGFAGTDIESDNLLPTLVYVAFWVGVPVLSLLVGDVFRLLSPWRAVGRAFGTVAGRLAGPDVTEPLPYPERLGRWPAVLGLFAFAFVELCWGEGRDPQVLAALALAYFTLQLVGMGLYGVEAWSRNGDAFGVYFGLFARLAPVARREDGRLALRAPFVGAAGMLRPAGTVALLCVAVGATAFDGAKEGPLFGSVIDDLQDAFTSLGLSKGAALETGFTLGLLVTVGLVALVYALGVRGMPAAEAAPSRARAFVHSLAPILAAYVVAHYFSLLAYNSQDLARLASDPLGEGSDLFGGADATVDYGIVSATAIWYVQVSALVIGHVAGLVLAHDRALAVYGSARAAVRSQQTMLVVMVAFTCLGLWLLSVSNA